MKVKNLVCIAMLATSGAIAATPSNAVLDTQYGRLTVTPENALAFKGQLVQPSLQADFMMDLTYQYSFNGGKAVLVQMNSGGTACPMQYAWIVLKAKGYTVSPQFGSCSDEIEVSMNNGKLLVAMPDMAKANRKDIFAYDGNALTMNGKPVK